jgi:Domain of Unknown Function with PDB structure (DUF3857)/Transglutaminase-like superfamily
MKIPLLYSLFLWAICLNTAQAQVDIKVDSAFLAHANAVLQSEEILFEVVSPRKATTHHKYKMMILNEGGAEYGDINLFYSKLDKINDIKVTLYDSFGSLVKKMKKSDIYDVNVEASGTFIDDYRVKHIKIPHTNYPYSLEVEYDKTNEALLFYENWMPQLHADIAVMQSKFTVKIPNSLNLRFKEINAPSKRVVKGEKSSSHTWEAIGIPAFKPEANLPSNEKKATIQVLTAPTEFEFGGYKGDMTNWNTLGNFFNALLADRNNLSPVSRGKIQDLVKNCTTPQCKMEKIYEYLQKNSRYVAIQLGIGGWQPFFAEDVHQKKYGDCKALSNYMVAMLEVVGIKGYYTIIRAGDENIPIHSDFAASQFNHVIVCVPQAKDTTWLECTSQTNPFGYLGEFTANRNALMVTPEGGKLVRTPTYKQQDNLQTRKIDAKLDETGTLKVNAQTTYTGIQQETPRYYASTSEDTQKKFMLKSIELPNFDLQSVQLTAATTPKVEEKIAFNVPNYATKSGKRFFLLPNILTRTAAIAPAKETRTKPVLTADFGYEDTDEVKITLPDGYNLEQQPPVLALQKDFGSYAASMRIEKNTLIYTRKMMMSGKIIPKERYPEFIDFRKQIAKMDGIKVVLVKNN